MNRESAQPPVGPEQNPRCAVGLLDALPEGAMQVQAPDRSVRSDKVVAVQNKLAAGTYAISSAELADKIIRSLLKG